MNTSQRNIVRIGCYLLAVVSLFAVMDGGFAPLVAAVVLVVIGKVVWAGRPMAQIVSVGRDVIEVGRAFAEVERADPKTPRKTPARLETKEGPTREARAPETGAPEIVRLQNCLECATENKGDAYKCRKCGALMRPRHGPG